MATHLNSVRPRANIAGRHINLVRVLLAAAALYCLSSGSSSAETGIRLDTASWVPARDQSSGWWGVVAAGGDPETPQLQSKTDGTLSVPPGAYDVYWVQDYETSDRPLLLAPAIAVEAGQIATLRADSGIKIEVADWVPARDERNGWWGAAPAGTEPDARVNWTRTNDALLLRLGAYDVYWVQDYETSDRPLLLAPAITVEAGQIATVRADSGIALKVPASTPAMDETNGWWGVTAPGNDSGERLHWSKGRFDQPLLLPPGAYDVHWKQNYESAPERRAASVAVRAGQLTEVDLSDAAATAGGGQAEPKSVLTSVGVTSHDVSGLGADFPLGVRRVDATFSWKDAPEGLRVDIRWSQGGTVVLEQTETLDQPEGKSTWYLTMQNEDALPAGSYEVQVLENGLALTPAMPFSVGPATTSPAEAALATALRNAERGGGPPPAAGAGANPGELLVSDDFGDPNSGWRYLQTAGVDAGYRDGRYRVAMAATPNLFTIAVQERPPLDDVVVEVEATPEAGSPSHPYGLMARGQDQANFHAFVIGADGSFAAVRVVDGQPALESAIDASMPPGTLSPAGQPNRLRLVADGPKLAFYVNDRLVIEVPDAGWTSGNAGFFVSTTGAAPVAVTFDNWRVWSIARNAAVDFATYLPKEPKSVIREVALSYADADENGYDPARSGTNFPHGTSQAVVWFRFSGATPPMKITGRWYLDGDVLYEMNYPLEQSDGSAWFGLVNENDRPLPDGSYRVELLEDGRPTTAIPFRITAPGQDAAPWSGRGWVRAADGGYVNQTHGLRLTMPTGWTLGDEMKWPARFLWLMSKLGPDGASHTDMVVMRRKDRHFADARELFEDELPGIKAATVQLGSATVPMSKIESAGPTGNPEIYEIVQDLAEDGSRAHLFLFVRDGIGYVANFKYKPNATPSEIAELDAVRHSMGL